MSIQLEQKSFYALNQAFMIRFPRIQRDYAQGRTRNAKAAAVRADFVRDLCHSLSSDAAPAKMDFIYGEVSRFDPDKPTFLPLDGQQRLTTLFLLHWLLSPAPLCESLKGVTYESRRAAMAFCEMLQRCTCQSIVAPLDKHVSDAVKRQQLFRPVWEKDQTVRGMLVMLDALQDQLDQLPQGKDYWSTLCDMKMFQCLQTNDVVAAHEGDGLTDRIYLKMNARGLALTPFEIIKSQIETLLKSDLKLSPEWTLTKGDIKTKLDQEWLKFFFRTCRSKFDATMTRFFSLNVYLASLTQAAQKDDKNSKELYELSRDPFLFSSFKPLNQVLANNTTLLTPLFRILEILSADANTYIPTKYKEGTNSCYSQIIEEPSWFMQAIIPSWDTNAEGAFYTYDFISPSNYAQRTIVYAASVFPFTCLKPTEDEKSRFKHWMRICWNLIQNSTVTAANQSPEAAVLLIEQLSAHAADIHAYLKAYSIPERIYAEEQLREEKLKIEWFSDASKGVSYEQMVVAESHYLLRGRMSLLLESPETFTRRYNRFIKLMPETEAAHKEENDRNHTRQKALVTKIETEELQKETPLPTLNTPDVWRKIIVNHEAAVRSLLDDSADLTDMLRETPAELWKQRMLSDNQLWDKGKHDRKGVALINGCVYLYTNPSYMTSAIPLGTTLPELWRKLFDQPDSKYPELNDGNTISVAASSCARLSTMIPNGVELISSGRLYFYPKRLIMRFFEGNTSRDVSLFDTYPSVDDIVSRRSETLWQEVWSKCSVPVIQSSNVAVPVTPAL